MKRVYLIAVVFALIAGFATYLFANQINEKTTLKDEDMVDGVVYALQDIPENTVITEEMFAEDATYFSRKSVLEADAGPDSITNPEDIIGLIVSENIYAGEQVSTKRFVSAGDDDVSLSFKLADGMVAYSFNAGSVTGVDGYIGVGDTVDVIINEKNEDGSTTPTVAYTGLKILRVSNNTNDTASREANTKITEYSTLTVEVTEEQALQLYNIETNYSFKLVLNPRVQTAAEKAAIDEALEKAAAEAETTEANEE